MIFYYYLYVCMPYICSNPQWPQESIRSPETKVSCFALPPKSISLGLPCLPWYLSVSPGKLVALCIGLCPQGQWRTQVRSHGAGFTGGDELQCGCGELSLGPLQEQPVLPNHRLSESAAVPPSTAAFRVPPITLDCK